MSCASCCVLRADACYVNGHCPSADVAVVVDVSLHPSCLGFCRCGTGLCGVELAGKVGELHGVDLSPEMVAKACERVGVYSSLEVDDLTAWLAGQCSIDRKFDVLVATDVFVYIGDLGESCSANVSGLLQQHVVGYLPFSREFASFAVYWLRRACGIVIHCPVLCLSVTLS